MIRVRHCDTSAEVDAAWKEYRGYPMDMNIGGPSGDKLTTRWVIVYEKGYEPRGEPDTEAPVLAIILLGGDGLTE